MTYISREFETFKSLPVPTWKRVKLPEDIFPIDLETFGSVVVGQDERAQVFNLKEILTGVTVAPLIAPMEFEQYISIDHGHKEGLGEKFCSYINSQFNHGLYIHAKGRVESPVVINYDLSEQSPTLVDHHLIVAESGADISVLINYKSLDESIQHHYGSLKVVAKEGARVKVTKLQLLNNQSLSFDQIITDVAEGASVIVNDAQVGSDIKAISNIQMINGFRGDAATYSIYYGQPQSNTDISYTMKHRGKKSTSTILSKGALEDQSKKVFRGNLVFDRGATGSVGKEEEFVVLLAEKLKSDSIPGLFCEEDDVIGEHAASVGQVDQNKLFYIMSRGFTEAAARKLIIKSGYEEVLQKMDIGEYAEHISSEIDRRIG